MVIAEARHLKKRFGARRVLSDASLEIHTGDCMVLLGGNGSGKSTLLQILAGVLRPDSGCVTVEVDVGYAPEKPDAPEDLGVPSLYGARLGSLSLGQRQRVSLAGAWMGSPGLLVLDEPTNALDVDARVAVVGRLAGTTALVATHDREFAEQVATRLWVMEGGSPRLA